MDRHLSHELYERSLRLMPGGVSSPVRAFKPYPTFIRRASGSRLYDVDGNEMIDYCMGFGPHILGHAHPAVVEAVQRQAEQGTLYGAPTELEFQLAETVRRHFPSMEMMRFVSSGTEATMHAIRLARGFTGRKLIVKMEGGFHGAHDGVLVNAPGAATHACPTRPECRRSRRRTCCLRRTTTSGRRSLLSSNRGQVAAVIVGGPREHGPVPPEEGYLTHLRRSRAHGTAHVRRGHHRPGCPWAARRHGSAYGPTSPPWKGDGGGLPTGRSGYGRRYGEGRPSADISSTFAGTPEHGRRSQP